MRTTRAGGPCRPRGDDGSYSVELALLVPVVLGIIFASIQAGLWFHARQVALAAAKRGVETGRAFTATPADGAAAATDFLDRFGGSVLGPSVSTAGSSTTQVEITVRGSVATLVPGLTLPVDQHAIGPKERWVP
jgi:Flp pilus assembly protein TadG